MTVQEHYREMLRILCVRTLTEQTIHRDDQWLEMVTQGIYAIKRELKVAA